MSKADQDDSKSNKPAVSPLKIQQEYWDTLVPIQLSLAPTSVSSPTLPPATHVLVSRCSYLHIALEAAVRRFHPFAPNVMMSPHAGRLSIQEPEIGDDEEDETTQTTSEPQHANPTASPIQQQQPYPVCWFEDEETKLPLRWHFFIGVLHDMLQHSSASLPWKIRLHFTNYPSSQLLPLETGSVVSSSVQYTFKNSLKQAIAILTGSSKAAMSLMTKDTHGVLWDAIQNGNCGLYHRVELPHAAASCIPVRLLVNCTSPPMQRKIAWSDTQTVRELLQDWYPRFFDDGNTAVCTVLGIELSSLDVPLHTLYSHCYAPDRFLYIVLI